MPDTQVRIRDGERIDDLQRNGYRLIQNPKMFCFGMDAVLLGGFAHVLPDEDVLDLCTGNGVIPVLLRARGKGKNYCAMEINPDSADLAERNFRLNGMQDCAGVVCGDICRASEVFGRDAFPVVTVNPPYMKGGHGLLNPDAAKAAARHEIFCTIDDVAREASRCLKVKGRLYMVHRPARLPEVFEALTRHGLEPKRMRLVYPKAGQDANMVLLEAVKGGGRQMTAEPPLIIYGPDGGYTQEVKDAY